MKSYFSASFFANNRAKLRQRVDLDAPIVLAANGLLQRTGDSTYNFQQDSNFWYLTGINLPDVVLVMTATDEYLIVPGRDAVRQAFDGAIDSEGLKHISGLQQIESERSGWELLRQALAASPEVFVCGTTSLFDKRHGLWANPATCRLHRKLKRIHSGVKLTNIDTVLAGLRVIKQPEELNSLRAAIDATCQTIIDVRDQLGRYRHEYELEAAITQGFRARGTSGHSFSPIVANGHNATTLHNVANNGPIHFTDLTVIDIGAEVDHYAADITRTVAAKSPSQRQIDVHQAVRETQAYALTQLKPGTMFREYEQLVARHMGTQLKQLGLITHIDYDSVRKYYPHATSHFLGLDVHDVGDYSQPLAEDMVLTCEPGIYIPEEGIGVRIEDDILIIKTGNSVLSHACPTDLFHVQ